MATQTLPTFDIDGSGGVVTRVPRLQHLGSRKQASSLAWDLYLESKGCSRKIGSYRGLRMPSLMRTSHNGFRDFEILRIMDVKRNGRSLQVHTVFEFDDTTYRS